MFSPTYDEFKRLAQAGNLIPIVREVLADLETPVSAFLKLREGWDNTSSTRSATRTPSFLLESVEGGENVARYSFLGVGAKLEIITKDSLATIRENGIETRVDLPNST